MKLVIVTPCGGPAGTFSASPDPQEVPDAIADDLLRAGYAITPKDAKAAAAPVKETTTKRTPKKETT